MKFTGAPGVSGSVRAAGAPTVPDGARAAGVPAVSDGASAASFHADMRSGVLGLDPRTHLVSVVCVAFASLLVVGFAETVLLQLVAAAYLALCGQMRLAVRACVSFAVIAALSFLPLAGLYGVMFVSLLHMTPPFTVGCALFSQSPSAIMCALARWRVPRRVLIGVCMAFRFTAVLAFEARSIMRGLSSRGIFSHPIDVIRHPALAYECLYTPLVMRCLRLTSELAASSELRGIDAPGERTSIHHVGLGMRDALAACVVAVLSAGVWMGGAWLW